MSHDLRSHLNCRTSQKWWRTPVIPALRRLRQENHSKLEASWNDIVRPGSKQKKKDLRTKATPEEQEEGVCPACVSVCLLQWKNSVSYTLPRPPGWSLWTLATAPDFRGWAVFSLWCWLAAPCLGCPPCFQICHKVMRCFWHSACWKSVWRGREAASDVRE